MSCKFSQFLCVVSGLDAFNNFGFVRNLRDCIQKYVSLCEEELSPEKNEVSTRFVLDMCYLFENMLKHDGE